jgi:hypothetical protein
MNTFYKKVIVSFLAATTLSFVGAQDVSWTSVSPTYNDVSWTSVSPTYNDVSWTSVSPTYNDVSWTSVSPTYNDVSWTSVSPTYNDVSWTTPTSNTTGYGSVGWSTTPINNTWNTGNTNLVNTGTGVTNYTCQTGTWNGTNCVNNVTGTVTTNYTCTTGTWNGTNCVNSIAGSVVNNYTCPSGATWNGTNCVNTITGTVVTNYNCPTNTNWNGTNCVNNVTGTVTTNYTCTTGTWNGTNCVNSIAGSVVNNYTCPSGATWNGTNCVNTITGTVVTNYNCQTGTTWNGANCINTVNGTVVTNYNCPTNTNWNGTNCVNNVTGTVTTNYSCPNGSSWNGSNCIQTVTGNVVVNTNCPWNSTWNGTNCVSTNTPPVITNTTCPSNTQYINGVCQQTVSAPVVTYQTCWNGSTISTFSVCPSQYKVCSNGASVPINQPCYVSQAPVITPIKIAFNNVVTSLATEVTNSQGRCNGIGLIAQGAQSTGWFEYGETANLGRTTLSANIGSYDTAPFSNLLTNLKPSTKYYCRAVMQNQYGTVKGELVSFVTKNKVTTYIKHVAAVAPIKQSTVVIKKNEITCSDGSTVTVKNSGAATLLTEGQKLVSLNIEKTEGKITSEGIVKFKVSFKNLTDSRLTGVVVKVKLPEEVRLLETNAGIYDAVTRTITLNQDTLDPYTEGVVAFSGVVAKDAALGKTIVTNAYIAYTVPGTNTQDEVTAYVIGSVVPTGDTGNADTGAKKVIGASSTEGKGFLPNSLIEWLALLAIMFIIFILGRSVYASYKEEDVVHH